jgi:hypothetical protein
MYSVINAFHRTIISEIDPQYVKQYEWIREKVEDVDSPQYQQQYRNFWQMNMSRLSSGFYATYFGLLKAPTPLALDSLCQTLCEASTRSTGIRTLQFSFATKLLHIQNPHLPIYDSRVARFYLFEAPASDRPLQERITKLMAFYEFLVAEYARVIDNGLLATAIAAFRERFKPQQHTDEKIVDWLIWALVGLIDDGALLDGRIVYS